MQNENKNMQNDEMNNAAPETKKDFLYYIKSFFSTIWRWTARMFFGASKELANTDIYAIENLESPSKLAVKSFFRRKLAVAALVVLVSLFLFVFIAPIFMPMDMNYTDPLQSNIAPNMSMLNVPSKLKNNVRDINGYSQFTVGVDNDNNLYMWGSTRNALSKKNYADFPEEIKPGEVYMAAAGYDHIVAITTSGKVIAWGDNTRAQYGTTATGAGLVYMPDFGTLFPNGLELGKIDQLVCGYQVTALVYDGELYLWGNANALVNLHSLIEVAATSEKPIKKVAFGDYYGAILFADGTFSAPMVVTAATRVVNEEGDKVSATNVKNVVDIAATNNCFAFVTANKKMYVVGAGQYGETEIAVLPLGESYVGVKGGTRHFVGITDAGKAYAWGHNDGGQSNVKGVSADRVFTGAKQTYLVDEDDDVTTKIGLPGYLFGTDKLGRDTFVRIIHGGKMTMTVGAVAVIVSSIIAIIVGCLSGYFGGWVDMLLMRITEICSAIPFLPFAMMLSYVIQKNPIDETTRIVIIMIILGLLSWTGLARMIRGQVLAEREKEFVIAAQSMGIKENRIAFKHILPNVISVILVSMTLDFAGCLLTESSLSYLGFGVQQPRPTWGNMLNGANNSIVIQNYWWQWVFPSIFLAIATISINIIGDTLRDVLDPKSSQEK